MAMMKCAWMWLLILGLAVTAYGGEVDDKLAEAQKLCRSGRVDAAQELLTDVMAKDSLAPEALYGRGLIRQYRGFEWDALFDYSVAAPKANGFLPAIKAFTRLAIDMDYLPNARKMARIYVSRLPKDPDPCLAMAEIDILEHNYDSALVWIDKAAALASDPATIAVYRAAVDIHAGRTDAGLAQMAGQRFSTVDQQVRRAELFQYLNMVDSAVACYQAAARLDPADATVNVQLGMYLVDTRRLQDARAVAEKLLKDTQGYGPAWVLDAYISKAANRPIEAETLFFKYYALAESPIAPEKHGDFAMAFGDIPTASIDYQNAFVLAGNLHYPDDYMRLMLRKVMTSLAESNDAVGMKEMVDDAGTLVADPDYDFYLAESMRLFPDAKDSAKALVDNRLDVKMQDEVWLGWAASYFMHNQQYDQAIRCYERLLQFPNPKDSSYLGLITACRKGNRLDRADALVGTLPMRLQNSRRINEAFLALYRAAGKDGRATVFAERLYRMAPGFLPYDTTLVSLYSAQGNNEAARAILTQYVETYPDDAAGYYILAKFDMDRGNLASVAENIERSIARDTGSALAYELKGLYYRENGRQDSALFYFDKAMVRQCPSPWAYYYSAENLLGRGDSLIRAAALGMSALSYFPKDRRGYELLGRIYLALKNYQVAQAQFAQGLILFPHDPVFQFYLGKTFASMGDQTQAKNQLDAALADGLASPFREEARTLLEGLKPQ
jgi:tetratricopeptide (TPR) repeat protein